MVKRSYTINRLDRTVKMTVTVPASVVAEVRAESKRQQRNLSNMVTLILRQHLGVRK